jgi:cytochrome c-type biogenesis protein
LDGDSRILSRRPLNHSSAGLDGRSAPALSSTRVRRRQVLAGIAVVVALASAIVGAALGRGESGLAVFVATVSGGATDALQSIGDRLPLGYAFAVGMAAAVNPCGFALLPTYLGLYLGTTATRHDRRSPDRAPLARALLVSATMTASFVGLFGAAGVALGVAGTLVGPALPWISLAVGVALVVIAGFMLGGGNLSANSAERLAGHLGDAAQRRTVVGYAAYGLAFALSSLGCTLPLFLAVVGSALSSGGLLRGLFEFVLYALGMGAVVTVLTVSVAVFGQALLGRARSLGRFVEPFSAVLLIVTGAYVVYYWLSAGGLLA